MVLRFFTEVLAMSDSVSEQESTLRGWQKTDDEGKEWVFYTENGVRCAPQTFGVPSEPEDQTNFLTRFLAVISPTINGEGEEE